MTYDYRTNFWIAMMKEIEVNRLLGVVFK